MRIRNSGKQIPDSGIKMGTRGVFGLYYKGKGKITYNHFDSYPECLGVEFLQAIKKFSKKKMKDAFKNIALVDENEKPTPEQIILCKDLDLYDSSVSNRNEMDWYCLLRNAQGKIDLWLSKKLNFMIDSEKFLKDSLFCEWGYIVNLDTNMLEVWQGFQKKPQKNRYKETKEDLEKEKKWWKDERNVDFKKEYYNCALIKEYPLSNLPVIEQFLLDVGEDKND